MAWQTPKTNWGQPGQTVPAATDFNRIEGNTQYLKDEIDSHLADYAQHGVTMGRENDLYVAKIGSLFEFTPLEVNYGGSIHAMATDDEFVYVGGRTTQTVRKLRKSDLSQVAESADYGGDIYAIAVDDNYVYVGGWETQTVKKLNKSDLSQVAESADYGGFIRAIATDDEFVYVGGEITRTVRKLRKSDLSQVVESADYGGIILAMATDDGFVYVGGDTTSIRVIENRDLIKIISRLSSTPQPYKIYGVDIDLTNSNPETAVTYTDDAVGMTAGSSAWDSMAIFKDIKPCVLKNGVVQYYLDPNDFTKKVDGSAADITSGNDGDVMIEIPKIGFLISTVGNILTVKVTNNPNNPNFKYYAHSRAAEGDRSKLYIGAYLGWNDGSKLRSLSGKIPTANQTIGTFRIQAKANGSGYDLVSFYPLTLLQCLYLIKYKNLDSQTALGRGYVDGNSAAANTGGTNQKGMFFGETTGKQQMKFLGIEDFWGNLRWWIDGLFSDASRNIKTAFQNFNDTGNGYVDRGQGATSNIGNYMSKPQGTSQTGFIAKEVSGSASTYFCDHADLSASRLPTFGGAWNGASAAGAFCLFINGPSSYSNSSLGGRLMYL